MSSKQRLGEVLTKEKQTVATGGARQLGGGDPVLQGLLPGSKDEAGGVAFSFPGSDGVGGGSNGGEELLNCRPWLRW